MRHTTVANCLVLESQWSFLGDSVSLSVHSTAACVHEDKCVSNLDS